MRGVAACKDLLGSQVSNCGGGVEWEQSLGSLQGAPQIHTGIRIFSQEDFMVWPRQGHRQLVFSEPHFMGSC